MPITLKVPWSIINKAYRKYWTDETRIQIYFGGSASGKSWFLVQRAVYDVNKGGRNYLIVRKVAGTIRRSVFNEVSKCIHSWGMKDDWDINKSDLVITNKINGYQILFAGLDDVEKLKSITPAQGSFTDCWIEEATEVEEADVKQLSKRLRGLSKYKKRIVMSFNPIQQTHWIYEKYFQGKWVEGSNTYVENGLTILKTTYKDNKFLSQDDIDELENETDKYWYDVYTLGNWGSLSGVIFTPYAGQESKVGTWRVEEFDSSLFDRFLNGCDFGFSADPAAANRLHYDKRYKRLYICDEIHAHDMTNDMLADALKAMVGRELVTCDSSEPKSIIELQANKVNAVGAIKGKDSVNFGIQWLKQLEIIIHPKCKYTAIEFSTYKWKEDRSGHRLAVPVDKNNHHIDGIRYACEHEMGWLFKEQRAEEAKKRDRWATEEVGSGGWMGT